MDRDYVELLAELPNVANDPVAFAILKRKIVQGFFDSLPRQHQGRLLALQDEINAHSAMAGTPKRALTDLLGEIDCRLEAMAQVELRLFHKTL